MTNSSGIRRLAEEASYVVESNPCEGMTYSELCDAERNLKITLRYVRMQKASEQIAGENYLSNY